MSDRITVVCPKCKAKLKFSAEKFISDVLKFKCPGCKTVLQMKNPILDQQAHLQPITERTQKIELDKSEPGEEMLGPVNQFEKDMGFVEDDLDQEDVVTKQGRSISISKEGGENESSGMEKDGHVVGNVRKFKRIKFKQKVLVDNQIMVETLDISEEGLFLHTGRSFDDGSIVEVGIPTMPGNFDLKVLAKVQHNHRGIGMGMQFVDLDDKQKAQLDKLINSLDEVVRNELDGRKRILLVGGSDTARNINKSKLVLDGFYVMQATSVDEVYKILQDETPDAMVLEWQETKFNCKGLLFRIKDNRKFDSIILIVLSALTDADVHREIINAGADRCMAKMDTNPVKLSQALSALIKERDD
jgi:CheY-like chemotaxis protein/phage FluMu protein Com